MERLKFTPERQTPSPPFFSTFPSFSSKTEKPPAEHQTDVSADVFRGKFPGCDGQTPTNFEDQRLKTKLPCNHYRGPAHFLSWSVEKIFMETKFSLATLGLRNDNFLIAPQALQGHQKF